MEKKTNKAKLEIFKFFRKSADKISRNFASYRNLINIHLLGYFCMQNHICDKNWTKSYGFHENANIIENHSFLLIV